MAMMTKFKKGPGGIITVEEFARAIKNSIDREGLKDEDAKRMAQYLLNFFGYGDRIIDNILEPEDRDAFYMLEDSGLLTTEREETTLHDGREWRIHYWLIQRDKILELANSEKKEHSNPDKNEVSIYDQLSDEEWFGARNTSVKKSK